MNETYWEQLMERRHSNTYTLAGDMSTASLVGDTRVPKDNWCVEEYKKSGELTYANGDFICHA